MLSRADLVVEVISIGFLAVLGCNQFIVLERKLDSLREVPRF